MLRTFEISYVRTRRRVRTIRRAVKWNLAVTAVAVSPTLCAARTNCIAVPTDSRVTWLTLAVSAEQSRSRGLSRVCGTRNVRTAASALGRKRRAVNYRTARTAAVRIKMLSAVLTSCTAAPAARRAIWFNSAASRDPSLCLGAFQCRRSRLPIPAP